jgi:hypothetical protein
MSISSPGPDSPLARPGHTPPAAASWDSQLPASPQAPNPPADPPGNGRKKTWRTLAAMVAAALAVVAVAGVVGYSLLLGGGRDAAPSGDPAQPPATPTANADPAGGTAVNTSVPDFLDQPNQEQPIDLAAALGDEFDTVDADFRFAESEGRVLVFGQSDTKLVMTSVSLLTGETLWPEPLDLGKAAGTAEPSRGCGGWIDAEAFPDTLGGVAVVPLTGAGRAMTCRLVAVDRDGAALGQVDVDNIAMVYGGHLLHIPAEGEATVSAITSIAEPAWTYDPMTLLETSGGESPWTALEVRPGEFYLLTADGYVDLATGKPSGWGRDQAHQPAASYDPDGPEPVRVSYLAPGGGVLLRYNGTGCPGPSSTGPISGQIMRIDPATGADMWAAPVEVNGDSFSTEGDFLVADHVWEGLSQGYDLATGQEVWSFELSQPGGLALRRDGKGVLEIAWGEESSSLARTTPIALTIRDLPSGDVRATTSATGSNGNALVFGDRVFYSLADRVLTAYDMDSGLAELWSMRVPGGEELLPTGGRLFVKLGDGTSVLELTPPPDA